MKSSFWIVLVLLALVVGVLIGYGMWGPGAAKLPEVENKVSALQSQIGEMKNKDAALETNLGKITNDKLNLEKENADLKDAFEKAQKASQEKASKGRR